MDQAHVRAVEQIMQSAYSASERKPTIKCIPRGKLLLNAHSNFIPRCKLTIPPPPRYVEMLEQQQAWLVNGLQELYRRSLEGESWPGEALKTESNGHPLTHDLLTRLGALDHTKGEHFEENPDAMQQDLWRNGMQRQESSDGSSEAHSPIARSRFSSDAFSNSQTLPPTPPAYSPSTRAQKSEPLSMNHQAQAQTPVQAQNQQYALSMQGVVNPLALQGPPQWNNSGFNPFDEMDLMSTADYSMKFEEQGLQSPMFNQMPMNCVGGDYDDFNQFLNPNPTEITSI